MPKLVLVADSQWVVNEVRAALAVEPWQVVEVSDPRLATSTVEEINPIAVVVDMQVGSMGGMAIVRDIRQTIHDRPRLVLLLDRSADKFIARRAGADAFVLKPIETAELRAALKGAT